MNPECDLGVNRIHILPPISICPTVLDRQRSVSKDKHSHKAAAIATAASSTDSNESASKTRLGQSDSNSGEALAVGGPDSFQVTPLQGTYPLLVFVNPKSGGRQVRNPNPNHLKPTRI